MNTHIFLVTSSFYTLLFLPEPLHVPAHSLISWHSLTDTPHPCSQHTRIFIFSSLLVANSWFACRFLIGHQLVRLTRFVSCLCLHYFNLSGLWLYVLFLASPFCLVSHLARSSIRSSYWHKYSRILRSLISQCDCLPCHLSVRFVSIYSCLFFLSSFFIEKVLDQIH